MKTIIVFGATGMLGSYLTSMLAKIPEYHVIRSGLDGENPIDIRDKAQVEEIISKNQPFAVINCAAYTNVENCEDSENAKLAYEINSEAPGFMAAACKRAHSIFVHISSDYVFGEGNEAGFLEDTTAFNPLNKYGESKLKGEQNIAQVMGGITKSDFDEQLPLVYIIRTSWLFGPGATNFLAKILKYADERDFLEVVTDEVSSPTYVRDLSEVIIWMLTHMPKGGIYHASGRGQCSRFEFAQAILQYANKTTPLHPTTLDKFPRKAKIAHKSYLQNTKLPPMREWKAMVADYIIHESKSD